MPSMTTMESKIRFNKYFRFSLNNGDSEMESETFIVSITSVQNETTHRLKILRKSLLSKP